MLFLPLSLHYSFSFVLAAASVDSELRRRGNPELVGNGAPQEEASNDTQRRINGAHGTVCPRLSHAIKYARFFQDLSCFVVEVEFDNCAAANDDEDDHTGRWADKSTTAQRIEARGGQEAACQAVSSFVCDGHGNE